MIALACYYAPRLRNLAEMRSGEHLCRGNDGTWRLEWLNTKTGPPLSPRLASFLVKSLELYPARHRPSLLAEGEDHGFLWISLRGSQLAPNAIRALFQRTGSTLIGQPLHPHQVRHGMATGLLNRDARNTAVAAAGLGHENRTSVNQVHDRADPAIYADVWREVQRRRGWG